ncbi:MAG: saccharopine dehydrogenase NADP-binding domain-containing protein [Bacteroidia bacterium]|nr:saccharopine dehydrogenase NADP-binding domain-containing protein [Bacteroidia bacterium]
MRNILVLGAGRSASTLINYLLKHSSQQQWYVTVADASLQLAQQKVASHSHATAIQIDVETEELDKYISKADIVISMLPAHMHAPVAVACLKHRKHLVTASYVSQQIAALHNDANDAGITFMNECGLDPGIDHMSAMKIIDKLHADGCTIKSFKSYCGGLVAPQSNNNPWGYKFTWNPRNVILAGQSTARYIENNSYKYIPYNRLFTQTESIDIPDFGLFDGYANRDSLSYRNVYGLHNIPTLLRGTLRYEGYCKAWDVFVRLGLTDDSFKIENASNLSYAKWLSSFLPKHTTNMRQAVADFYGIDVNDKVMDAVWFTGIASDDLIGLDNASPAQILQHKLEQCWQLQPNDKDLIVMVHLFDYEDANKKKQQLKSWLTVIGDDAAYTAMANTVGLPLAIVTKLILNGQIKDTGVLLPVKADVYNPILNELETLGVVFNESHI